MVKQAFRIAFFKFGNEVLKSCQSFRCCGYHPCVSLRNFALIVFINAMRYYCNHQALNCANGHTAIWPRFTDAPRSSRMYAHFAPTIRAALHATTNAAIAIAAKRKMLGRVVGIRLIIISPWLGFY